MVNNKERQAVTREYKPRYHKASKKSKQALLAEFTRLTGYHRKSAVRLLAAKPVKLKPEKKRPANRKGKRVYSGRPLPPPRLDILLVQVRSEPLVPQIFAAA